MLRVNFRLAATKGLKLVELSRFSYVSCSDLFEHIEQLIGEPLWWVSQTIERGLLLDSCSR
jgi:hypothetical protein